MGNMMENSKLSPPGCSGGLIWSLRFHWTKQQNLLNGSKKQMVKVGQSRPDLHKMLLDVFRHRRPIFLSHHSSKIFLCQDHSIVWARHYLLFVQLRLKSVHIYWQVKRSNKKKKSYVYSEKFEVEKLLFDFIGVETRHSEEFREAARGDAAKCPVSSLCRMITMYDM